MTIVSGEHVLSSVIHVVAIKAHMTEHLYIISVAWAFRTVAYEYNQACCYGQDNISAHLLNFALFFLYLNL